MERRFGFQNSGSGRPSGIRPPSAYKPVSRSGQSKIDGMPSSASTRKVGNNLFSNLGGSGGSRVSGVGVGRNSVFGGFRSQFASSARKSNVTGKLSLFSTTPQHNRLSFAPNTGSSLRSSRRGSSIGGSRHVKENRPLSEPSYHRQCAEKLIVFLTANGYQHQINKRLHSHPTVSDIQRIFEFLFGCMDLKVKVSPMDAEIPKMMALLEYPFPVKKSDLVSFTNGRALGSVLGMLEWLIDSINYGLNMDPIRTFYPNFDGEVVKKYELIKISLSAPEEPDGNEEEFIDQQLKDLSKKIFGTEEDYGHMIDEQEKLEEENQRLDDDIMKMRELPQDIKTYEADITNHDKYIVEMEAHHKCNEELLIGIDKELEEKITQRKRLEEQKKLMKIQVSGQEFGIEELELARDRKQQIEEEIKQENLVIEEIKKSIKNIKLECSKYEDMLKKMFSDLDSFINTMYDLINSPVMTNYTSSLRKLLDREEWLQVLNSLQTLKSGEEDNSSDINELENVLSEKVHELKIAIVEELSALQGSIALTLKQKSNERDLSIEEKERQLKNYDKQVHSLMTEMENNRKEQVSQIATLQSECDRNRQLINEFDGDKKKSQKEAFDGIRQLRKEVDDTQKTFEKEKSEQLKWWTREVDKNKKGLQTFNDKLETLKSKEININNHLKGILNKTKSLATKQKTRRTKREKENENK